MLKLLTSILAILSFSFSSSAAVESGAAVKVPLEALYRNPKNTLALSGTLWLAKDLTASSNMLGRAVLILKGTEGAGKSSSDLSVALREKGFHVLELALREVGKKNLKTLVEDIQSGVVFLKTDPRVEASRVLIVGTGAAANGVAHYVSANKQMGRIVDGIALVGLSDTESLKNVYGIPALLVDPVKKMDDVCQTHCRTVRSKSKLGPEFRKTLIEFLVKPNSDPQI